VINVAKLISHGHTHAYNYPTSFFNISLEQLADETVQDIQYMAIAARGAQAEDFDKFINMLETDREDQKKADHAANISLLNQPM
jgi:hypothetical protein